MTPSFAEIRKVARERIGGYCRVCNFCDGVACRGKVPGVGGVGSGASFINNVKALAQIQLNIRTMHRAVNPDITINLFGEKLSSPLIIAPMAGMSYNLGNLINEEVMVRALIEGAFLEKTMVMTGDGRDKTEFKTGLEAICEFDWGIPVLKPWSQGLLRDFVNSCEESGIAAVGIDLDGVGLFQPDTAKAGQPRFAPKSFEELKQITSETSIPVFFKGIMTEDEADLAVKAGAGAIVISNHGGRVLDHTPGTVQVLAGIVRQVKGRIPVLVDGGIRTGVDILKCLALGADAVMMGRPFLIAAAGGGSTGVGLLIKDIIKELRLAMLLTGCQNIEEIPTNKVIFAEK